MTYEIPVKTQMRETDRKSILWIFMFSVKSYFILKYMFPSSITMPQCIFSYVKVWRIHIHFHLDKVYLKQLLCCSPIVNSSTRFPLCLLSGFTSASSTQKRFSTRTIKCIYNDYSNNSKFIESTTLNQLFSSGLLP